MSTIKDEKALYQNLKNFSITLFGVHLNKFQLPCPGPVAGGALPGGGAPKGAALGPCGQVQGEEEVPLPTHHLGRRAQVPLLQGEVKFNISLKFNKKSKV